MLALSWRVLELHEFERLDDATLVLPGYQEEIIWGGLGLTSMAILPHADSEKYGNEVARLSAECSEKIGDMSY